MSEQRARVDIVRFIERACRTEYGEHVTCDWWQPAFLLMPVFHTYRVAQEDNDVRGIKRGDLLRKYNEALEGICKKNGKSDIGAYTSAYMGTADDPNPNVYGMAGDKEQARIVFDRLVKMIRRSEELRGMVKGVLRDRIDFENGFYQVLSADTETAHGLNPSFKVFDEAWNQTDYKLFEAVSDSPSRAESLELIITYAGIEMHEGLPLWDKYQRGMESPNRVLLMDEEGNWTDAALAMIERTLTSAPHLEKYIADSPLKKPKHGPEYPGWEEGDTVWTCDLGTTYIFWSHVNLARWVDQAYLDSQKLKLPRVLYNRMHRNRWPVGEGSFVTEAQVIACEELWTRLFQ